MYTLEGNQILDGDLHVATVIDSEGTDTGARLVAMLNLAIRDEHLLDHIANLAADRNLP